MGETHFLARLAVLDPYSLLIYTPPPLKSFSTDRYPTVIRPFCYDSVLISYMRVVQIVCLISLLSNFLLAPLC